MTTAQDIDSALNRIKRYIHKTPIITSSFLNHQLGHDVFFKVEAWQKVGAFKARGGFNSVAHLIEQKKSPKRIIANSSGNHAQAIAWAAQQFNIPATIYAPQNISKVKARATLHYGASLELIETRTGVDDAVAAAAEENGVYWIPPYNHPDVIAGQGTAAREALTQLENVDAVFAPCGGGGLLSGTLVAFRAHSPDSNVFGVEPLLANDAAESLRQGHIVKLAQPSSTLADGARTPSVGILTFPHLQQLDDFFEAPEEAIIYWTQWLTHLLKVTLEPTSAMAMFGVTEWLKTQKSKKRILVILSGGNIDQGTRHAIWENDFLDKLPKEL